MGWKSYCFSFISLIPYGTRTFRTCQYIMFITARHKGNTVRNGTAANATNIWLKIERRAAIINYDGLRCDTNHEKTSWWNLWTRCYHLCRGWSSSERISAVISYMTNASRLVSVHHLRDPLSYVSLSTAANSYLLNQSQRRRLHQRTISSFSIVSYPSNS